MCACGLFCVTDAGRLLFFLKILSFPLHLFKAAAADLTTTPVFCYNSTV
ncbi:hypothetical protein RUMCAL_02755 [Ruminococcus callidus ATCC 27760]|uniref:Uncharacterized protein n=1 Tax=Ruminococcus callidus ATCC 27760 TaxID=411473 RepID=U2LUG5_9FIRM|nr:hypothetical protein RUMCAL_02755 [Ruminococcus callidus ATCC 27760]